MTTDFFTLVTGEALTFESLLYHLPGLKKKAEAGQKKNLVILTGGMKADTMTTGDALGALQCHLSTFCDQLYTKLAKEESWKDRRAAINKELAWFVNPNKADKAGITLTMAAEKCGLDVALIRALITNQLAMGQAEMAQVRNAMRPALTVLDMCTNAGQLFDGSLDELADPADVATTRTMLARTQAQPFGNDLQPNEAFQILKDRLTAKFEAYTTYAKLDPQRAETILSDFSGMSSELITAA